MMKKILSMLAVVSFLAGCVNVHVHFPPAPAGQSAGDGDTGGKAP